MPEAMVIGLTEHKDGHLAKSAVETIAEAAANADAVVAGPGMATGPTCKLIANAVSRCEAKLVLDAALLHSLEPVATRRQPTPLLLPHSGELASLLDCDEDEIEAEPIACRWPMTTARNSPPRRTLHVRKDRCGFSLTRQRRNSSERSIVMS